MAKLSLYTLLVVLLTTAAATVSAASAEAPLAEAPLTEEVRFIEVTPMDDLLCPFRFNFTICWVSISKVEGCTNDLFKSITSFQARVSADCCKAITDVSDKCFSIFGGLFAKVLRGHCIKIFPNVQLAESLSSSAWGKEGQ